MENEKQQAATAANAASRGLPCFDDEEKMSCAIASKTTRGTISVCEEEKTYPPRRAWRRCQGRSIFAAFVSEAKGRVRSVFAGILNCGHSPRLLLHDSN